MSRNRLIIPFILGAGLAVMHSVCAEENAIRAPYQCHRAAGKVIIDGELNEPAWNAANAITLHVPVTLAEPLSRTEVKLLWDDSYIYICYKAWDKDIWSHYTKRDDRTCAEDVLEFQFKTDVNKEPYYYFEINALGTIFDGFRQRLVGGGENWHRWVAWDCAGARVAISVSGTLNDCNDVDDHWRMELAVPFADLPTLRGGTPKVGDKWLFNVTRYDYSIYLPQGVELSSYSPLSQVDFHRAEEWSIVEFVK